MIKRIIISTCAFLLLLLTFFFINQQLINNLNNLKNITLKNISIDGKTYSLENGKVYQNSQELFWFIPGQREKFAQVVSLAGFYMWNKEDPLLTSPDFDTKDFQSSLKLLETQSKSFQKDINLTQDIFPLKFLYSVANVKIATDAFSKKPTLENAKKLIDIQKQTINYYKEDLQQRISFIEPTINDKNKNDNIIYMSLATTPQIIMSDYKILLDNATVLEKQLQEREECLSGKTKCKRPSNDFPSIKSPTPTQTDFKILPEDRMFQIYSKNPPEKLGPFSVSTPCVGLNNKLEEQKQAYFLYKGSNNYPHLGSRTLLRVDSATDNFFRRITNILKDKVYRQQGVTVWGPGSATATYGCPDLTYWAKLANMNSYIPKINKNPLFINMQLTGNVQIDQTIKQGRVIEHALINEKIKDYDVFVDLQNLYLRFYYQVYSGSKLTKLQTKADIFLSYGLGMQRLLADFPFMLNKTTIEFISFSIYQRVDNLDTSRLYRYGIRNIPSFTYFSFSSSFLRTDGKLQYYEKRLVNNLGFDKRYLTYEQAITRYTEDEIRSWFVPITEGIYAGYLEWEANNKNNTSQ